MNRNHKPNDELDQLLQELHHLVENSRPAQTGYIVHSLDKFARIQIALSRRAEKQTQSVIRLTWALLLLTILLLVLSGVLAFR